MAPMVEPSNQSVANGVVSAEKVMAGQNGWLVVHRTDAEMKPGPVVGYAPLREGENIDVAAILTEEVKPGEMLMLMVHGEDGGMVTGGFEYTLGAKEDGPIRDRRQAGDDGRHRRITAANLTSRAPPAAVTRAAVLLQAV